MSSPTTKTKEKSTIKSHQKFVGHTGAVWDVKHLPGGQRIITCSSEGSLRVWNLKSGKQIGEDWRDGKCAVYSIALSPDGKKVVSGSSDGAVRLWDINTCKVIARWTGHTQAVRSVCWSGDGQSVLSGCHDGTARQWDVESGEIILEPIKTGWSPAHAVIYSPDMALIATSGSDYDVIELHFISIWDAKSGKLVATLKGHTGEVICLAWTADGKTLASGSRDGSVRTWNTTKWEQIAVLDKHTHVIFAIAISPNGRILASPSRDNAVRLWNLDNGQLISSPFQHTTQIDCISFSADGQLLATGCLDKNAYTWDVAAIVKKAGLDDLLSDPKVNKSVLHSDATRRPVQRRPPAYRIPQGFFDEDRSQFSAQSGSHFSSESQGSTLLHRLFRRSPSNAQDTSPSSPLKWTQALLKRRGQSSESTELQGRSQVVEVPCAPGQRRNACAREKRKRPLPWKNPTVSSSRPPKPNATQQSGTATQTQPSSQPQPVVSTAPAVGNNAAATSSAPSRPDVMLRQAGIWTRFWLFVCCLSPEYQDGHH